MGIIDLVSLENKHCGRNFAIAIGVGVAVIATALFAILGVKGVMSAKELILGGVLTGGFDFTLAYAAYSLLSEARDNKKEYLAQFSAQKKKKERIKQAENQKNKKESSPPGSIHRKRSEEMQVEDWNSSAMALRAKFDGVGQEVGKLDQEKQKREIIDSLLIPAASVIGKESFKAENMILYFVSGLNGKDGDHLEFTKEDSERLKGCINGNERLSALLKGDWIDALIGRWVPGYNSLKKAPN